jgi:hypothetical protein
VKKVKRCEVDFVKSRRKGPFSAEILVSIKLILREREWDGMD